MSLRINIRTFDFSRFSSSSVSLFLGESKLDLTQCLYHFSRQVESNFPIRYYFVSPDRWPHTLEESLHSNVFFNHEKGHAALDALQDERGKKSPFTSFENCLLVYDGVKETRSRDLPGTIGSVLGITTLMSKTDLDMDEDLVNSLGYIVIDPSSSREFLSAAHKRLFCSLIPSFHSFEKIVHKIKSKGGWLIYQKGLKNITTESSLFQYRMSPIALRNVEKSFTPPNLMHVTGPLSFRRDVFTRCRHSTDFHSSSNFINGTRYSFLPASFHDSLDETILKDIEEKQTFLNPSLVDNLLIFIDGFSSIKSEFLTKLLSLASRAESHKIYIWVGSDTKMKHFETWCNVNDIGNPDFALIRQGIRKTPWRLGIIRSFKKTKENNVFYPETEMVERPSSWKSAFSPFSS